MLARRRPVGLQVRFAASTLVPFRLKDIEAIGGSLSWSPLAWRHETVRAAPQQDIRSRRAVRLYWSVGAVGAISVLPLLDVSLGTDQVLKPFETALASFTHLVAYTVASLVKQAAPVVLAISDKDSVVGKRCCPAWILTPRSLAAHRHGKSQTRSAARDASQGLLLAGIELHKPQPLDNSTVGGTRSRGLWALGCPR